MRVIHGSHQQGGGESDTIIRELEHPTMPRPTHYSPCIDRFGAGLRLHAFGSRRFLDSVPNGANEPENSDFRMGFDYYFDNVLSARDKGFPIPLTDSEIRLAAILYFSGVKV